MPRQIRNWNPMRDLIQMSEAMNRYLDDETLRATGQEKDQACYRLPIDAYSNEDAIVIEAAMAGAAPDNVDITIDGDSLTIRAEVKPSQAEDEKRSYLIRERGYGILERSLTLNVPVELDKVEANFANGVLTLTVPKAETIKPRKIAVKATA